MKVVDEELALRRVGARDDDEVRVEMAGIGGELEGRRGASTGRRRWVGAARGRWWTREGSDGIIGAVARWLLLLLLGTVLVLVEEVVL
jgi:hypothetical protein